MEAAIARSAEIKYVCPECGFKLTVKSPFYTNIEVIDKLLHKLSDKRNCASCKGTFDLSSVACKIEDVSDEKHYLIGWQCEECKTIWHSLERRIKPGMSFTSEMDKIKSMMCCIKRDCESRGFQTISLVYSLGK